MTSANSLRPFLHGAGIRLCAATLLLLVAGLALPPAQADEPRLPLDLQLEVNTAIEKGKMYLVQQANVWTTYGTWADESHKNHALGYSALPALVLLECGVPKTDPRVVAAAAYTRQKCLDHKGTYEISLSILLLDKLGYKQDDPLIEKLALRLMAGQSPSGGWSYKCPLPTIDNPKNKIPAPVVLNMRMQQEMQIHAVMLQVLRMRPFNYAVVPPLLAGLPVFTDPAKLNMADPKEKRDEPTFGTTDGSNTQFAILALWAARRHGVPVKRSLDLVVKRYETSQNDNGAWGYHYKFGGGETGSPSMTGVGLLGLTVGYGLDFDQRVAAMPTPALAFLAGASHTAHASVVPSTLSLFMKCKQKVRENAAAQGKDARIPKGFAALAKHVGKPLGRHQNVPPHNLYFLWSVERVGVLYSLPTIGQKDWYRWGCEILVANQKNDGHWQDGDYHGHSKIIDTCLALLFLKRANFATDLAMTLPFDPQTLIREIDAQLPTPLSPTVPTLPSPSEEPTEPSKAVTSDDDSKAITDPSPELISGLAKNKTPQTPTPFQDTTDEEGSDKKALTLWLVGGGLGLLLLLALLLLLIFLLRPRDDDEEDERKKKKKVVSKVVQQPAQKRAIPPPKAVTAKPPPLKPAKK